MELSATLGKYLQRLGFTHPVNWSIQLTEGEAKISMVFTDKDPSSFQSPPGSGSTLCERIPSRSGPRLGRKSTAESAKTRKTAEKQRKPKRKSPSTKRRDAERLQAFLEKKTVEKGKSETTPPVTHNPGPPSPQTASSPQGVEQERTTEVQECEAGPEWELTDPETLALTQKCEETQRENEEIQKRAAVQLEESRRNSLRTMELIKALAERGITPTDMINTTIPHSPLKATPEKTEVSPSDPPQRKKAKMHQNQNQRSSKTKNKNTQKRK